MKHLVELARDVEGLWMWRCSCGEYEVGYGHECDAKAWGGLHGLLVGRVR